MERDENPFQVILNPNDMLSIIVCSTKKTLSPDYEANIRDTVGISYEIITVDNSIGRFSIFEAYNYGVTQSHYPYLCFVHEDVKFHTNGWGKKVVAHLNMDNVGIIGVAGGQLATRIPDDSWRTYSVGVNLIQSDYTGKRKSRHEFEPAGYAGNYRTAVLLDGVFLCMRRDLYGTVRFDETLPHFHGYDVDICLQTIIAGYTNYVIYDVLLEHFSWGRMTGVYYRNLFRIYKKWEKYLPLAVADAKFDVQDAVKRMEKRKLGTLCKHMVRTGFSISEIRETMNYYTILTTGRKQYLRMSLLPLRIAGIWLISLLRGKCVK